MAGAQPARITLVGFFPHPRVPSVSSRQLLQEFRQTGAYSETNKFMVQALPLEDVNGQLAVVSAAGGARRARVERRAETLPGALADQSMMATRNGMLVHDVLWHRRASLEVLLGGIMCRSSLACTARLYTVFGYSLVRGPESRTDSPDSAP